MKIPIILLTVLCIVLAGCLTASASYGPTQSSDPYSSNAEKSNGICNNPGTCTVDNSGLYPSCSSGNCRMYNMDGIRRNDCSNGNCGTPSQCPNGNCGTTTKPIDTTTKPIETTIKPIDTITKPIDTTTKPIETTIKPIDTTTKPIETTIKPIDTTTKPIETTIKPIETTIKPIGTTTKPIETTEPVSNPSSNGVTTYTVCTDDSCHVGSDGSVVEITNYDNAANPSYDQLLTFLKADKTEEHPYIDGQYICVDFAKTLHDNAEKSGIKAAFIGCDFSDKSIGHAFNMFNTTDKGIVYIDDTGTPGSSIYEDKILNVAVGQPLTGQYLFKDGSPGGSMGIVEKLHVWW